MIRWVQHLLKTCPGNILDCPRQMTQKKEMEQQHKALADTRLGAALMRACETSTLARSARIDVGPCLGAGLTFCLAVVSEEEARCAARC